MFNTATCTNKEKQVKKSFNKRKKDFTLFSICMFFDLCGEKKSLWKDLSAICLFTSILCQEVFSVIVSLQVTSFWFCVMIVYIGLEQLTSVSMTLTWFQSKSQQCQERQNWTVRYSLSTFAGARVVCWLEHWTWDQKVAGLSPGRSGTRIFFSRIKFLFWLSFGVCSPYVNTVAQKRPQSFGQKCRWQLTPKPVNTLNPMKLEWAGHAVQA